MSSPEKAAIDAAVSFLAVANTPLFVVGRLKENSSAIEFARSVPTEKLVTSLRRISKTTPKAFRTEAKVYLYCAALAMKGEAHRLRAVPPIDARFYKDIAEFLIAKSITNQAQTINLAQDPVLTSSQIHAASL